MIKILITINKDGLTDSEVCEFKEFLGVVEPNEIINVLESGSMSMESPSGLKFTMERTA